MISPPERNDASRLRRRAVLRCLAAAALFGASAPAASVLAGDMGALALAGLLYLGAAVAVGPAVARRPPSWASIRSSGGPLAVAVVVGGALGPVLLVAGLTRTTAATASILLNVELAATVVIAAVFFGEHLGRRVLISVGLVTTAGALLVWEPGARVDVGALLVVGACVCWGLDNSVTARIDQLSPETVVMAKGVVAGSANLLLGLFLVGGDQASSVRQVLAAMAIGALGYGLSITLWVKGARDLGAVRAQVIFATAPFIGAAIAWTALGETVAVVQLVAVALAAAGVAVSLRSAHEHAHRHDPLVHDHEHVHPDDHHRHDHSGRAEFVGRHSHPHEHTGLVHSHAHVPDLHHRHRHESGGPHTEGSGT